MSNPTRRHFLGTTAAAAAALVSTRLGGRAAAQTLAAPAADPLAIELANEALNVVRGAGATYADARVGRYRRQTIQTRERQVSGVSDEESYGLGVRALVNGCWGFAATSTMTRAGVQKAAQEAVALARAARTVQRHRVELAPTASVTGTWMTPVKRDPLEVPLEEKIALLIKANEAALRVKEVRFVSSGFQQLREVKTLVTSEGTNVTQTFIRVGPYFSATATAPGDFQTYEHETAPRGQGWEYVRSLDIPQRRALGVVAAEKLTAKSVEPVHTTSSSTRPTSG
jgi:TldD protein